MNKKEGALIWDFPTRIFHWLLAGGFFTVIFLAFILGDDSPLFPYHGLVGLALSLMIFMRVFWGFVGSRYARFSSFALGPRAVIEYISGVVSGSGVRHTGHNPGSAWAIFAVLSLMLGLAITGLLMGQGTEGIEELHEFLAYPMLAVVVLHILGVLIHTLRHRENIVASMIHGRKNVDVQAGIKSSHPMAALIFCVVCGAWGFGLLANYNPIKQTTRLPLIGALVHVGEEDHEGQSEQLGEGDHEGQSEQREHEHDEDD